MDDLILLRDLGRDLEHDPPATLARQRTRLMAAPRPRRPRGWLLIGLAGAVTAAAVVAPVVLLRDTPPSGSRIASPAKNTEDLNILILGSDARSRGDSGARADTTLLVRLPADRRNIRVLSFPRDTIVGIPACGSAPGRTGLLNSAFTTGGPECARKTIASVTGVRIDHTLTIDFLGFRKVVDALGGIEITVPKAIDDRKAGLKLSAGRHKVTGETALAFVRARHGLGDGSDLDRIRRQQQFMNTVVTHALSGDIVADPAKLLRLHRAATATIKTDAALTPARLLSILSSLAEADAATVRFVLVPVRRHPADPNRLQLRQPQAGELFRSLAR